MLSKNEIKDFLDFKVEYYNKPDFIENDPISIPHRFSIKEDIEISAFLTATISWGNRKAILGAADKMIELMGNSPCDYVLNANLMQLDRAAEFYYRTFNSIDFNYFIKALRNIYFNHSGLESVFNNLTKQHSIQASISEFKKVFFELPHPLRTTKHISDPVNGSAAKRINMMLRWLVRKDNKGVDFGIWDKISPSKLSCPLDLHSGNTARKLGILLRTQNDAKAVIELDAVLQEFDPQDPSKYDFALFGLGVIESF
jgi:uncharacterized protein (TIGR02757 family)